MCVCMYVCVLKVEFSYGGATDSGEVAGHWSLGSHKEAGKCLVSAGRAKKEGANSQERGQTVDIQPKESTNTCHPENSTG